MNDSGYAITPNVLTPAECDELLALPELNQRNHRAGVRHLMSSSAIAALAQRLAAGLVPFRATFFDKSPAANWLVPWHQDTALPLTQRFANDAWGPWSTKDGVLYAHAPTWALERILALRVSLDDSTAANGPLRVLPGSHRLGVLSDEAVATYARTANAVDCLVPRGGVLAMRPLLIHSSAKILRDQPRRVLHIEYADALTLAHGIQLAVA